MAAGDTKVWIGGASGATTSWNTAANWSPSGVPADGEIPVITASAAYDIDGFDAAATVQFRGFIIEPGCTINIGSAASRLIIDLTDSATAYAATLEGSGEYFLKINNPSVVTVSGTGTYDITGLSAAANVLNLTSALGTVYIARSFSDTAEFDVINISGGQTVYLGSVFQYDGSAAPSLNISTTGTVTTDCALATVIKDGGTLNHEAGTITALTDYAGTTYYTSTGTLTTYIGGSASALDFTKDLRGRTITNATIDADATINDPFGTVTWTNGIDLNRCNPSAVTLNLAKHKTISLSAI